MMRLIYSNCLLYKADCFSVLNPDQCYYSGNNICQSRHSGESRNPELVWMPPYQVRGRLIKSGMTFDMFNCRSNNR